MIKDYNSKSIRFFNFVLALVAVVVIGMLISFCYSSETTYNTKLAEGAFEEWSEGWTYCSKVEVTLPYAATWNKDVPVSFANRLPEDLQDGMALCFSSNFAVQKVFIGKRIAYSYGEENSLPIGRINGNIRILIPLSAADAGRPITIVSTSNYSKEFVMNPVLLGQRDALVFYILNRNIWRIVIAPLLLLIALLVLAIGIYHGLISGDNHQTVMAYFAAFVFSAAVWIITSGDIMQFFSDRNGTFFTISFLALMVMPITFAGFLKHIFEPFKRALQIVEWIGYGNLFLQILVYSFGATDPMELLFLTHGILMLTMLVSFIASIGCCRNDIYAIVMLILMLLFLGSGVGAFVFFYNNPGSGKEAVCLAGGIFVFSVGLLGILESKGLAGAKAALQTSIYKNMAYTDALTGLNNRMALEKDVDDIIDHLAEGKWVVFLMCDLNRLKQTNDTYGHEAGDKMIQDAATCIREAIPEEAHCYRLGGDEFGVLLSGSEITAWYLIDKIEESMSKYNVDHDITLSMAMGSATAQFSREQDGFFKELYKKADDMMYEVKRKQHLERAQARQS